MCEYCEMKPCVTGLCDDNDMVVWVDGNRLIVNAFPVKREVMIHGTDINYCPMCGDTLRKREDNNG